MANTYGKVSGTFEEIENAYGKVSGVWEEADEIYAKNSGTWELVFAAFTPGAIQTLKMLNKFLETKRVMWLKLKELIF